MADRDIPSKKDPLVSIVVLNWNGLSDTLACLDSIEKLRYKNYEVIVVDNGSEESIRPLQKRTSRKIKLVKNPVNLGFAGGQLSALPHCHGEYLLLLNNDALIHPSAIERALRTFSKDSRIGVVGSRSHSIDDGSESLAGFYSYQWINPVSAEVSTYRNDDDSIKDTPTVSGSGVMIRRSAIDEVGYFDNRFFAYYEETDLFARYLRAGLRIVYDPSFVIWHKDGASTKNKKFMYYYLMLKNQFLFAYKNFDRRSLKNFRRVYFRNFRRSLWVYLRDRANTEGIHKARVRSTIWNLLHLIGTMRSRRSTQAVNPGFSYNELLRERQPTRISLIVDATSSHASTTQAALQHVLGGVVRPSEVIVVSDERIDTPPTTHDVVVRNIVKKKLFKLSVLDYGFMSSNTDTLVSLTPVQILSVEPEKLGDFLVAADEATTARESAFGVEKQGSRTILGDFRLIGRKNLGLVSIGKSDLVTFLDINPNIHSLSASVLSRFAEWCISESKPVARLMARSIPHIRLRLVDRHYMILRSPVRWYAKKAARTLHLARVLAKLKKPFVKINSDEAQMKRPTSPSLINVSLAKSRLTPILINTRDRVEPLKGLIAWLEKGGYTNIAFVDNDSTYPELLEFFEQTPYQVIQLGRNGLHKAPWESFAVRFIAKGGPYVVSDPDILPTPLTPTDTIRHLGKVLNRFPAFNKAGVALSIQDIPDSYQMRESVIEWERRFWDESLLIAPDIYAADVDTTLALYRGGTPWFLSPSIRVAGKYTMRHEPWYQNLDKPSNDMMYYRTRASHEVSTWIRGKLPKHHLRALKKEGLL
mgnify:CR=1 FL=1